MTPQAHHSAAAVEEMLLDAGLAQDGELRRALLSLGALADLPVPRPGPELAALLVHPVDQLQRRRKLRRHRAAVVALTVAAGMGLGATGVAASSVPHSGAGSLSVQHLLEDWSPSWSIAPAPSSGSAHTQPPAAEPAAGYGPEPVPGVRDSTVPDPGGSQGEQSAADGGAAAKTPPASGAVPHRETGSAQEPAHTPENAAQEAGAKDGKGSGNGQGSAGSGTSGPAGVQGIPAPAAEAARNATKNGTAPEGGPVQSWLNKSNR